MACCAERRAPWRAYTVALILVGVALVGAPRVGAEDDVDVPECISVRSHARPIGYGYHHIVHLTSTCSRPASCDITTNVNPQSIHATVSPGGQRDVVTFQGSPARTFDARVRCQLVD